MGVERQTAKMNWISSFGMIVAAGTLFRIKRIMKSVSKTQVKDIMERYGFTNSQVKENVIVRQKIKEEIGYW